MEDILKIYNISWFSEIESTNIFLNENQDNFKNKSVIATLNQTKGRGSKDRTFESVAFKTLAFSILLKNIDLFLLKHIPIISAVCFIKTLNFFSIENCKIKWFNDILIENKKIAGILCQSSVLKKANVIVGIGVNLLSTEEELQNLGLFKATSIFSKTNKKIEPSSFLEKFLSVFDGYITNYSENDLIEQYIKNCQTIGKEIKIYNLKTKEVLVAKAKNFLSDGSLLVEANKNFLKLNYNDFSVEEI